MRDEQAGDVREAAARGGWVRIPDEDSAEWATVVEAALRAETRATCGDPECCPEEYDDLDRRIASTVLRAAIRALPAPEVTEAMVERACQWVCHEDIPRDDLTRDYEDDIPRDARRRPPAGGGER